MKLEFSLPAGGISVSPDVIFQEVKTSRVPGRLEELTARRLRPQGVVLLVA